MKRSTSTLAIITARGGSKGIPQKNIIKLNGKPLIGWSIEAAQKAHIVSRVVVTSDSDEILSVAAQYGADCIKRPARLAQDSSSSESAIAHSIKYLEKKEGYSPEYIVLLQPTSPLRNENDIDAAFNLLTKKRAELVISVSEVDKKYLKLYVLKDGKYLCGAVNDSYPYLSRHLLPTAYLPNGAIYLMKTRSFMSHENFVSKKAVPYIMEHERGIDIDTLEDLRKAEAYFKDNYE